MLILSNGSPKSATSLYFHLTTRLAVSMGGNKGIGEIEALIASGELDGDGPFVRTLTPGILSMLISVAERTGLLIVKVHTEAFPELLTALESGQCKMTYGYRDPRDMILSARDHNRREKEFFAEYVENDSAIKNAEYWARESLKWVKSPKVKCYSYNEILLNPFVELQDLAAYLDLDVSDGLLQKILLYEKANREPGRNQLNQARLMRYHIEMDKELLGRCNRELGDLIAEMGFQLEPGAVSESDGARGFSLDELEDTVLINFNGAEKSKGVGFRWSRAVSSLRVRWEEEEQVCIIETLGLRRSLLYQEVAAYLGDKRIPQSHFTVTSNKIYFEIPREFIIGESSQLLTLTVEPLVSKEDQRELGIPISRVSFVRREVEIPVERRSLKLKVKRLRKRKCAPLPVLPVWRLPPSANSQSNLGLRGARMPMIDRLIVSHSEVNNRHGSGILIQQFFPKISQYGVLLTAEHYGGGSVDNKYPLVYSGNANAPRHLVFNQVIEYFAHYHPRQVYIVPYSTKDFHLAIALKDIFKCEVCIHIMDDNYLYGERVSGDVIREALAKVDVSFGISPQLVRAYNEKFDSRMRYFPPTIPERWINMSVAYLCEQSERPVMIGNVWSGDWMDKFLRVLRESKIEVDWYANNPDAGKLMQYVQRMESSGLFRHSARVEVELLQTDFGSRSYAIIPSAPLDGHGDEMEKLARLSLPSRAILLAAGGNLPILVVGSRESAIAQFVIANGIGEVASYEVDDFASGISKITDPENNKRYRANAMKLAASFSSKGIEDWIWQSTSLGRPADDRFERMMTNA